jgi:hypothetical protein
MKTKKLSAIIILTILLTSTFVSLYKILPAKANEGTANYVYRSDFAITSPDNFSFSEYVYVDNLNFTYDSEGDNFLVVTLVDGEYIGFEVRLFRNETGSFISATEFYDDDYGETNCSLHTWHHIYYEFIYDEGMMNWSLQVDDTELFSTYASAEDYQFLWLQIGATSSDYTGGSYRVYFDDLNWTAATDDFESEFPADWGVIGNATLSTNQYHSATQSLACSSTLTEAVNTISRSDFSVENADFDFLVYLYVDHFNTSYESGGDSMRILHIGADSNYVLAYLYKNSSGTYIFAEDNIGEYSWGGYQPCSWAFWHTIYYFYEYNGGSAHERLEVDGTMLFDESSISGSYAFNFLGLGGFGAACSNYTLYFDDVSWTGGSDDFEGSFPGEWSTNGNVGLSTDQSVSATHSLIVPNPAGPPFSASVAPSSATITINETKTFTVTVTDGSPPYSYQWYVAGERAGETASTFNFSIEIEGFYAIWCNVTDAVPNEVRSNIAYCTVVIVSERITNGGFEEWHYGDEEQLIFDGWDCSYVGFGEAHSGEYGCGLADAWITSSDPINSNVTGVVTFGFWCKGLYGNFEIYYSEEDSDGWGMSEFGVNQEAWTYVNCVPLLREEGIIYKIYFIGGHIDGINVDDVSLMAPLPPPPPPLSVSVTPSIVSINRNMTQTFVANATGGLPPYTYAWYVNGTEQSNLIEIILNGGFETGDLTGWTTETYPPYPEIVSDKKHSGNYSVTIPRYGSLGQSVPNINVNDIDSFGLWAYREGDNFVWFEVTYTDDSKTIQSVDIPLTEWTYVNISSYLESGKTIKYLYFSGSVFSNQYLWVDDVSMLATAGIHFNFRTENLGFYEIWCNVTDSALTTVTSNVANCTVEAISLEITVSPSIVSISLGQYQNMSASVVGGTPPLQYQWYRNGTGVGTNSLGYEINATEWGVGVYTLYCNVTDNTNTTEQSNVVPVYISGGVLTVTISPSGTINSYKGLKTDFTSTVSGGFSPYRYEWYVNSQLKATTSTYSLIHTDATTYNVILKVYDSGINSQWSNMTTVIVSNPTVTLSSVPTPVKKGTPIALNCTVTSGYNYTYSWYHFTNSSGMVINGGFETGDFTGWEEHTAYVISGTAHSGSYCAKGNWGYLNYTFNPVSKEEIQSFTVWAKKANVADTNKLRVVFFYNVGYIDSVDFLLTTDWQQFDLKSHLRSTYTLYKVRLFGFYGYPDNYIDDFSLMLSPAELNPTGLIYQSPETTSNTSQYIFAPLTAGLHILYLTVTINTTYTTFYVTSNNIVFIAEIRVITLSPLIASTSVEQNITLTCQTEAGVDQYTYEWFMVGAKLVATATSDSENNSFIFTPNYTAIYTFRVYVTFNVSSIITNGWSNRITVYVPSAPSITTDPIIHASVTVDGVSYTTPVLLPLTWNGVTFGGFETGNFNGWGHEGRSEVTSQQFHSGNYSAHLMAFSSAPNFAYIDQSLGPIPKSSISSFGFWYKGIGEVGCDPLSCWIELDNAEEIYVYSNPVAEWTYVNLYNDVPNGRSIVGIFFGVAYYIHPVPVEYWVDDVSLITGGTPRTIVISDPFPRVGSYQLIFSQWVINGVVSSATTGCSKTVTITSTTTIVLRFTICTLQTVSNDSFETGDLSNQELGTVVTTGNYGEHYGHYINASSTAAYSGNYGMEASASYVFDFYEPGDGRRFNGGFAFAGKENTVPYVYVNFMVKVLSGAESSGLFAMFRGGLGFIPYGLEPQHTTLAVGWSGSTFQVKYLWLTYNAPGGDGWNPIDVFGTKTGGSFQFDTWYNVTLLVKQSSNDGFYALWVDGVLISYAMPVPAYISGNTNTYGVAHTYLGSWSSTAGWINRSLNPTSVVYFDDEHIFTLNFPEYPFVNLLIIAQTTDGTPLAGIGFYLNYELMVTPFYNGYDLIGSHFISLDPAYLYFMSGGFTYAFIYYIVEASPAVKYNTAHFETDVSSDIIITIVYAVGAAPLKPSEIGPEAEITYCLPLIFYILMVIMFFAGLYLYKQRETWKISIPLIPIILWLIIFKPCCPCSEIAWLICLPVPPWHLYMAIILTIIAAALLLHKTLKK